jgi:uncharacterized protein YoxC
MRANSPTTGGAWILAMVMVSTACHPTHPTPRSEGLARQLNQVALTAERDSLRLEVAANDKLLGGIQAELATVTQPSRGTPESPSLEVTKDQRTYTLEQVHQITTRLKAAASNLAASERRARRLTQAADSLSQGFDEAKATIATLVATVDSQRATMEALNLRVEGLVTQTEMLTDSVYRLSDAQNTAYYVIGTRKDLVARGVLVEAGHRSVPFIGRRGVQPARELPLKEFTSIDRSAVREIPLPHPERTYRIVSGQNLTHVPSTTDRADGVRGVINIVSPEEFWEPSRYLIVMEK